MTGLLPASDDPDGSPVTAAPLGRVFVTSAGSQARGQSGRQRLRIHVPTQRMASGRICPLRRCCMPLKGKYALITGGSRGIGRGIALKLAHQGVKIAVHYYKNEEAAQDTLTKVREQGSDG